MQCECGCGEETNPGRRFLLGHNGKLLRKQAGLPDRKVCEQCGRTYGRNEVAPKQPASHWIARRFCGDGCRRAWNAAHPQPSAEKSPNWKGDSATVAAGNKRARRMYPEAQPCEVCGQANAERHHRNGVTTDNSPENIMWLCRKHHIGIERRNAYKRKPMTPERLDRRRAKARERARRYRARKRAQMN